MTAFAVDGLAQTQTMRKAHADRNEAGVVTPPEIQDAKQRELNRNSKIHAPRAAQADVNKNGSVISKATTATRRSRYIREIASVERPWEKMADANNDGKVSLKELRVYHVSRMDADGNGAITIEERRVYWNRKRSVANTPLTKQFDVNGDGYLSWEEGRMLLKERLALINSEGKAIITTDLEMEFDVNGDGVIDRAEESAVQAALKE